MLMHRGEEFKEALVCSCTGAVILMRPQCTHARGLGFPCSPTALPWRVREFNKAPCAHAQGP